MSSAAARLPEIRYASEKAAAPARLDRRLGAALGGGPQRGFLVHRPHQGGLQRRRRLDLRHRPRQRMRDRLEALHLRAAALAAGQVALQHLGLELGQRAQQVGAQVLLILLVTPHAHATASPSPSRILSSASRILPFTVPSGMLSMSAICECVKPPK